MSSSGGNSSETARHYPAHGNRGPSTNHSHNHASANRSRQPQQSRVFRKAENAWRDWREYKSKTGRSYYFNVTTKENCWEKPAGWDPGGGRPQTNGRHPNRNLVNAIRQAVEQLPRENTEPSVTIPSTNNLRPPKKRHLPPTVNNPPLTNPNADQHNRLNGDQQQQPGVFKPARLTRAEEFKRVIDEIPKLPECPDFEALRPLKDNNLISEDVRKLTNEPNEKQILDIIPSKTRLHKSLAQNSTRLKHFRAKVRLCQVMRSYLDDRLSNYRSEMKILIEGGNPSQSDSTTALTNNSSSSKTL